MDVFTEGSDARIRGYMLPDEDADTFFDASPPWREFCNILHQGATYVNTPISGITVSGSVTTPVLLVGGLGFGAGICKDTDTGSTSSETYFAAFQAKRL